MVSGFSWKIGRLVFPRSNDRVWALQVVTSPLTHSLPSLMPDVCNNEQWALGSQAAGLWGHGSSLAKCVTVGGRSSSGGLRFPHPALVAALTGTRGSMGQAPCFIHQARVVTPFYKREADAQEVKDLALPLTMPRWQGQDLHLGPKSKPILLATRFSQGSGETQNQEEYSWALNHPGFEWHGSTYTPFFFNIAQDDKCPFSSLQCG